MKAVIGGIFKKIGGWIGGKTVEGAVDKTVKTYVPRLIKITVIGAIFLIVLIWLAGEILKG